MAGERVAQLMKRVSVAFLKRLSSAPKKIDSIAVSLVTTVSTISDWAVTSAKVSACLQASSEASDEAASLLTSFTQLIV